MSLAGSMKTLVDDISASTRQRHAFITDIEEEVADLRKETQDLIARFKKEHEDLIAEIEAGAKELHISLAANEKERKEDYSQLMKEIGASLSDIRKWQNQVRKDAQELMKDAQELMKEFAGDIKEARVHWRSLDKNKTGEGVNVTREKRVKKKKERASHQNQRVSS